MYGAGLFDGPADYEQDMRGGTPTRGWGGQGQGYGTPTGEWRGRGGTPMGDRMTPMGWGGRGGTPMGDRMTPMGYERESMTPVEWREESVGVSMERREGGVSGSRRERGKRSRVLERNGDYEAKLFGGIPSQVLTDFHGDGFSFFPFSFPNFLSPDFLPFFLPPHFSFFLFLLLSQKTHSPVKSISPQG